MDVEMREDVAELIKTILRKAVLIHKDIEEARINGDVAALRDLKNQLILLLEDLAIQDDTTVDLVTEKKRLDEITRSKEVIERIKELLRFAGNRDPPVEAKIEPTWKPVPYSGDPKEWKSFWGVFAENIHNTSRMDTAKLKCLIDCLSKKALESLGSMELCGENYTQIVKKLHDRYNDPAVLREVYMQELQVIPIVTDGRTMRNVLDRLQGVWRNFELIATQTKIDENVIVDRIMSKFQEETLRWVLNELADKDESLEVRPIELLNALNKQVKIEEFISRAKGGTRTDKLLHQTIFVQAEQQPEPARGQKRSQSRARSQSQERVAGKSGYFCAFCENTTHGSGECRKYPNSSARKERLAVLKRCFNCLGRNHYAKQCNRTAAKCASCSKTGHLTVLCRSNVKSKETHKRARFEGMVILQTFGCMSMNPTNACRKAWARGLLDTGSNRSFVSQSLANTLRLVEGHKRTMVFHTFMQKEEARVEVQEVQVILINESKREKTINVTVAPYISGLGNLNTAPKASDIEGKLPQRLSYADPDLFEQDRRPIEILIGNDIYHEVVNITESRQLSSGLALLRSFFGWVPSGNHRTLRYTPGMVCLSAVKGWDLLSPVRESLQSMTSSIGVEGDCKALRKKDAMRGKTQVVVQTQGTDMENLTNRLEQANIKSEDAIENLWRLDKIGIENPEKDDEEERALMHFQENVRLNEEGRFEVRLPWRDRTTPLPTNFRMAVARLKSLLERTPMEKLKEIEKILEDQLNEGIIEKAPYLTNQEPWLNERGEKKRVHYLPHRWVQEPTKIRIVYDASAKTKTGHSLNDLVYRGVNLTTMMVGLLINFRLNEVALTADIKGAYLQISLNKEDRDATRFLWVKNSEEKNADQKNLEYYRFARVPFGINASPFLLNMVLQTHFAKEPMREWSEIGQKHFYVDNFVISVHNPMIASNVYEYMCGKLQEIKMELRDWATNDPQVDKIFSQEKRERSGQNKLKVLGLIWDKKKDTISCKMNEHISEEGTKRNVLKFLASIYDPLNLYAPCLLELRIFLKKCWKNKLGWNEPLPLNMRVEWEKLRQEASNIAKIEIPRRYWNLNQEGKYMLHIFCDASKDAYACCAYLNFRTQSGMQSVTSLIFSKLRLSPPKEMSIPRLELMGVTIGKRTAEFLQGILGLPLEKTVIWTDATTVLQWLKTSEVLQPFVQNRIVELRKATTVEYRHVSGSENPADYATRGKTPRVLKDLKLWWNGPLWLGNEHFWPQSPPNVELFKPGIESENVIMPAIIEPAPTGILNERIEKVVSRWDRKIRVLRTVIVACFLMAKIPNLATEVKLLKLAERLLIVELQWKYFSKEIQLLKRGIRPPSNLDLFLGQDGLLRCGGRLRNAGLKKEGINPILLPRESPATESLLYKIHSTNCHVGVSHVLALFREKYWITKARAKVKSIIHKCWICRLVEGKSYSLPPMPPLPPARVTGTTPFLQVGIDYFGPLYIIGDNYEEHMVQVLLFTCLVTRAIHLELVPSLSGEHCCNALSNFSSLRRVPQLLISDNASTFRFLERFAGVRTKVTEHQVQKYLENNRIEWYYIPQYSPWYGGAYERLIGLVKRCLKKAYGRNRFSYETLRTILYRTMDIVNNRPLMYVPSDELIDSLTPNHFLRPGPANVNITFELNPKAPATLTGSDLLAQWKSNQALLDHCWSYFRTQYIAGLRERHLVEHPHKKGSIPYLPSKGDPVLVEEPSAPRNEWKLGVIVELDKRQAQALVKCKGGKFYRSIRQLYPLEVPTTKMPQRKPYPRDWSPQPGPSTGP